MVCFRCLGTGRWRLVGSNGASPCCCCCSPLPLSTSLLLSSTSSKGFSCSGSWIWTIFSPVQRLFQPSERGVSQNWQVVAAELIPGALCACAAATIFAPCAGQHCWQQGLWTLLQLCGTTGLAEFQNRKNAKCEKNYLLNWGTKLKHVLYFPSWPCLTG